MPHFFLMNEDKLSVIEGAKIRSQLHIRAGIKLIDHDKITHAIGTLYDAVERAMRYCALKNQETWGFSDGIIFDNLKLVNLLEEKQIFPPAFDFKAFEEEMEMALEDDFDETKFNKTRYWIEVEEVLTQLGVYPFDDKSLPEEDENTRKLLGI